jgi:hypothetical protein
VTQAEASRPSFNQTPALETKLSFLSYNIEGTSSLYDAELRTYISNFDVCLLVETFACSFPNADSWFPNHKTFIVPGVKLSDSTTGRLSGGLFLLIKKELVEYIDSFHVEYDNMIAIKMSKELFNTEVPVVLIGVYLPPSNSAYYSETEISNGVVMLEQCLLDITEEMGDVSFLLLGDFNSRTGSSNACDVDIDDLAFDLNNEHSTLDHEFDRVSKDYEHNEFGNYLLNVCEEFDLKIMNGFVNDVESNANFTYISPTGCSVVDYFILSTPLLSLSPSMFIQQRTESKHMPIELYFGHSESANVDNGTRAFKFTKYVWNEDKTQEFIGNLEASEVQQLLDRAMGLVDIDINMALSTFNDCLLKAGEGMKRDIIIGEDNLKGWFDRECKKAKHSLRKSLRQFVKSNSFDDREKYNEDRRQYKELIKNKKKAYRSKMLTTLQESLNNATEFWSCIKKNLGNKQTGSNVSANEWFTHFENVFNDGVEQPSRPNTRVVDNLQDESVNENVEIEDLEKDISEEEVKDALNSLKNGKAAGSDFIIGEFMKYAASIIVPFMVIFLNKLFSSGIYPNSWTEAIIQPIHKKGDKNNPDNYRGISLLSISSKVYGHILNGRLNKWIENNEVIGENQAGFRKHYSTVDHIFTLFSLIQKQLLSHKKLYVAFIDFRKAFDFVQREKLWEVLKKNGIKGSSKMYKAITSMYDIVKAKVRVGGNVTETFMCPRGLKQGDKCSPVLFSLFIEELAKEICQKGKHGLQLIPEWIELFILMFADDVVLVSDSVLGLQNQLDVLYQTAQRLGLIVNLDKSNIIVFRNGGYLALREQWRYGCGYMKVVNVYKYLGVLLSTRLSFSHALKDVANRARKGVVCILRLLWVIGEKTPSIFYKLFDAQIQPMLNYGAEIWGLEADLKVIERVHLFALKRFLNVSIRTPNDLVYGETGRYPLYVNVYVKCVKYWLRILRMSNSRLPRKSYNMLLYLHEQNKKTWVSSVCFLLYKFGFDDAWQNQGVGNEKMFIGLFKERLILHFGMEWRQKIEFSDRYKLFSSIKQRFGMSTYLIEVKHIQARNLLIKVRLGVSELRSHKYRFKSNATEEELLCPVCLNEIETEIHFILKCPMYKEIREQYISKKYYNCPSLFKLTVLFASQIKPVMFNLGTYLVKAFNKRKELLLLK